MWRLQRLQRAVKKEYFRDHFCGIEAMGVHLTTEAMVDLIRFGNAPIVVQDFGGDTYPFEFSMVIKDVKFYTLVTYEEVRDNDLAIYIPMEMRDAYYKWIFANPRECSDAQTQD
jgi:hypothetical protein